MKTALERAFELARSGKFEKLSALRRALAAEGYPAQQVAGPVLYEQLRQLMKTAKAAGEGPQRDD